MCIRDRSNPQDMSIKVINTMAKYENICNYIHLPVQSGSNRILKKMNRQHTIKEYFQLIDSIREILPECGISHDMIAGFPTETIQDHQDTLKLMDYVKYDFGFMFAYSETKIDSSVVAVLNGLTPLFTLFIAVLVAIISFLLLETINYIEHYGLLRKKINGRYEKVQTIHSWNSNHIIGRIVLYELTRPVSYTHLTLPTKRIV